MKRIVILIIIPLCSLLILNNICSGDTWTSLKQDLSISPKDSGGDAEMPTGGNDFPELATSACLNDDYVKTYPFKCERKVMAKPAMVQFDALESGNCVVFFKTMDDEKFQVKLNYLLTEYSFLCNFFYNSMIMGNYMLLTIAPLMESTEVPTPVIFRQIIMTETSNIDSEMEKYSRLKNLSDQ